MTNLDGALPRQGGMFKKTVLKVGYGAHRGYWIGLGDTIKEQSNDSCKRCKGQGSTDGQECQMCDSTGRQQKQKVAVLYQLGPDLVQEEWVTYTLSGPGTLPNGKPKSPSTLWTRMRSFSNGITEPEKQKAWFDDLRANGDIRLPIEMIVIDNPNGEGCVIADVKRLPPKGERVAPPPPPLDDDEVPF